MPPRLMNQFKLSPYAAVVCHFFCFLSVATEMSPKLKDHANLCFQENKSLFESQTTHFSCHILTFLLEQINIKAHQQQLNPVFKQLFSFLCRIAFEAIYGGKIGVFL